MERYASGDDAAFGELYDQLSPRLHAFFRRQLHGDSLAEDLVQQTFFQIHRARGQFIRGAEVLPWAFAIARNLIADSMRHRRVEPRRADLDESEVEERPSADPAADDLLHARRVASRIEEEISRLPDGQRVVFQLLKQDGLSLSEAAQVLGTSVTAIKLRAHRAYSALRSALRELDESEARK